MIPSKSINFILKFKLIKNDSYLYFIYLYDYSDQKSNKSKKY